MLRFNFFGFPVSVHWMFWIVSALLGSNGGVGSPNPGVSILIWMAVVFVSILVHELGHVIFQKKYLGGRPKIHLYGMGGLAIPEGGRRETRKESMIISLMGPFFGLALGLLVWRYSVHFPPGSWVGSSVVRALLFVNIFWSLVNLLPVLPLDGGRFMEAVLKNRQDLTLTISMVTGAAVAVFAMLYGQIYVAVLFGYLAYQSYQRKRGTYGGGGLF